MSRCIIDKCVDCGTDLYRSYSVINFGSPKYVEQNFREFNSGSIKRCLSCCEKKGIPNYKIRESLNSMDLRRL